MKKAFTKCWLDINKWGCLRILGNKKQKKKQTDTCSRTDLNISLLLVTATFSLIVLKPKRLLAFLKAAKLFKNWSLPVCAPLWPPEDLQLSVEQNVLPSTSIIWIPAGSCSSCGIRQCKVSQKGLIWINSLSLPLAGRACPSLPCSSSVLSQPSDHLIR